MIVKLRGFLLSIGLLATVTVSAIDNTPCEDLEIDLEPVPDREIVETQVEFIGHEESRVYEFTYNEAQDLLKVAFAEAGNQGEEGMWLVMSVVINRKESDTFPDTIYEVIHQPHQFSTVSNGSINKVEITEEAHLALARIESGDVKPEIIGFETLGSRVLDKYFDRAFEYKDHRFYVEK